MKKTTHADMLTAADCARRTGLTVRALRVYERAGLLKPSRSANGYRQYGTQELTRLNTIVALKGFGLTLAQIRKSFQASPPVLAQVLDLQSKAWAARAIAAERAIALIQSAIARLRENSSLSVDELCELMRKTEMDNTKTVLRELIDQHITPEQEREWMAWWSRRSPQEVANGQQQMDAFRQIAERFLALMRAGASPESPEVQALAEASNRAWLDSDLRQQQLMQLDWNPEVTRAWFKLGSKLLSRSAAPADVEEARRLEIFMNEARRGLRSSRLLLPLALEAVRLRERGARLTDPESLKLAKQYASVCKQERLGDPALHARWIAAFAPNEETRPGWEYLAHLSAH